MYVCMYLCMYVCMYVCIGASHIFSLKLTTLGFMLVQSSGHYARGPALMAMWSKALPLIASCLSPLSGFESHPGHMRNVPVS